MSKSSLRTTILVYYNGTTPVRFVLENDEDYYEFDERFMDISLGEGRFFKIPYNNVEYISVIDNSVNSG